MRLAIGLAITLAAFLVVGRRGWYLYRLIGSGQPAPGRMDGIGARFKSQVAEVLGQRKLLKWSVPGRRALLHVLGLHRPGRHDPRGLRRAVRPRTSRSRSSASGPVLGLPRGPLRGRRARGLATFAVIRIQQNPRPTRAGLALLRLAHRCRVARALHDLQRHRGRCSSTAARRSTPATSRIDDDCGLRVQGGRQRCSSRSARAPTSAIETIGILLQIGVVLGFLVIVVYCKHLHIFLAPLNVAFQARARTRSARCCRSARRPADRLRGPRADEDDIFGRGKIEDFTWKGMLDFATCTECGRCQSQCPAWNTGKPLSPKLLIMDLRDHAVRQGAVPARARTDAAVTGVEEAGTEPSASPARLTTACRSPVRTGPEPGGRRSTGRSSAPSSRAASSTPTCCGRAPRAARASSSARSTSSTSTTSSTCAASRC